MRLPCTPLISTGSTFEPFRSKDRVSETEALGCGATAIWNSNVVGDTISTSSSAATSRLNPLPFVHLPHQSHCRAVDKRRGPHLQAESQPIHDRPEVSGESLWSLCEKIGA